MNLYVKAFQLTEKENKIRLFMSVNENQMK